MTEREERRFEVLITPDDYIAEMTKVGDIAQDSDDETNYFDKTIALLAKGMFKKYKYIIKISAKYCRRQSWLSVLKDMWTERQRKKAEKHQNKTQNKENSNESQTNQSQADILSSSAETAPKAIEVVDKPEVKQLTNGEDREEKPHKEEEIEDNERTQKDEGSE